MTFLLPTDIKGFIKFRTKFLYKLGILKGLIEGIPKSLDFIWLTVLFQEADPFLRLFI